MRDLEVWLAPGGLGPERLNRLRGALQSWGTILFGMLAAQALSAVSQIIAARRVLPIDYGQYLACLSLSSLLVILPAFGMDNWLLAQGAHSPERVAALWRNALRVRLPLLALWLAALVALGLVLPQQTYPLPLLVPMAFDVAADSTLLITLSALRLLGRHGQVAAIQVAAAGLVFAAALVLPIAPGRILVFAVGQMVAAVGAAAGAVWLTARRLRAPVPPLPAGEVLRPARAFMLSDLAAAVYGRSSLTLSSLLVGAGAAGSLGPALSVTGMTFLVPAALYSLALPALARAWGAANHGRFWRVAALQLLLQSLGGLCLSAAIFFLTQPLVHLIFGGRYDAAILLLRVLSPIPFLKSVNFGLAACLTGSQHQARRTGIQYVAAACSALAGLVAIYSLGVLGAAGVEVLTETVLTVGYGVAALMIWRSTSAKAAAT